MDIKRLTEQIKGNLWGQPLNRDKKHSIFYILRRAEKCRIALEISSLLDGLGFDPYPGYFHAADYGRASLVYVYSIYT